MAKRCKCRRCAEHADICANPRSEVLMKLNRVDADQADILHPCRDAAGAETEDVRSKHRSSE